jgi:hypothetical protein
MENAHTKPENGKSNGVLFTELITQKKDQMYASWSQIPEQKAHENCMTTSIANEHDVKIGSKI